MSNTARLDDDLWRSFGASIQRAREKGLFGGKDYVSVFDPKQAKACREIDARVNARWENMPITYTKETP